jgi:formylglycine-generating enzyme required for sulfatase activity
MTVLFLDANDATRAARAQALQDQEGWTVHAAACVAEARAWLEGAAALDLLITEAIPDASSSGFELRDAALAKFPSAKVLFTTRYDLTGFESKVRGWPVLLDAPYAPEKLVARANAALAQEAPSPLQPEVAAPFLAPGTALGHYQILDRLTLEEESETYRAIQTTVQRPVALVMLRPHLLSQPESVEAFKARERLKASISHPRIAPLYEAGSVNGLLFYTRELPRGRSLEELQKAGVTLSERRLAELLFGVAEAMHYGTERAPTHRRLSAMDIYLDDGSQASIVNLFRPGVGNSREAREEVKSLLDLVAPLASEGKARGLLTALSAGEHDWSGLLDQLDDVRDAMRERSIMRRIEAEDEGGGSGNPVPWWAWVVACLALVAVFALGALAGKGGTPGSEEIRESEMVLIPEGPFLYQNHKKPRVLPAFAISKHEVTMGQYGEFLKALETVTGTPFDHPEQPKSKTSHMPPRWEERYTAAKAGATFNGQPMSLDTPVTQVDWWDAYAYAKWKGQRLPTEEEWEKAARGGQGLIFPWGNEPAADAANLGDDYDANGKAGGEKDGFKLWAPAHRKTRDVSAYGVCDMAGNVSEWTAAERKGEEWPAHPAFPDLRVPVVRGGHFALKSSRDLLTTRYFAQSAGEATITRGFRTASDTLPGQ